MCTRRLEGFTVFELIVALAITAVIAAFVFSFGSSLAKLWNVSKARVDTELDANIVLDRIAMDLEAAVFQERGVPMFAVSATSRDDRDFSTRWVDSKIVAAGRPTELDFDPDRHLYGWAGSWLRFFSAEPSVNAVGYQIIRRPAFSNSKIPRYLLHRTVVRHDNTLEAGLNITAAAYSGTGTTAVDAYTIAKPWVSVTLMENVIDFGVRLYVFDKDAPPSKDSPAGLVLIYPSTDGATLDKSEREHFATTGVGPSYELRYPDVVEVFIRVLNQTGADLLQRNEDVENLETYEDIVEKYGHVYRRMIRLPAAGA